MRTHANRTTGLNNGRAANWEEEVKFSAFCTLSHCQNNDVPVLMLIQLNIETGMYTCTCIFLSIFRLPR